MQKIILEFVASVLDDFKGRKGNVLDVGAYDVNGNARSTFTERGWGYTGTDMCAGPNVDVVANADEILSKFGRESYEAVSCLETIEHMYDPVTAVRKMREVLKPGGLMILTAATNGFGIHRYPVDCWRILPDAMVWLLKGYEDVVVRVTTNHSIMAKGVKPKK